MWVRGRPASGGRLQPRTAPDSFRQHGIDFSIAFVGKGDWTFLGARDVTVTDSLCELAVAIRWRRQPEVAAAKLLRIPVTDLLGKGDGTFRDSRSRARGGRSFGIVEAAPGRRPDRRPGRAGQRRRGAIWRAMEAADSRDRAVRGRLPEGIVASDRDSAGWSIWRCEPRGRIPCR